MTEEDTRFDDFAMMYPELRRIGSVACRKNVLSPVMSQLDKYHGHLLLKMLGASGDCGGQDNLIDS